MNDDKLSKGNLDDIPYEIEKPSNITYFIDNNSLLKNILIYFIISFFFGFSFFIIYFFTHTKLLQKSHSLSDTIKYFKSDIIHFNFTNVPFENAHLKLNFNISSADIKNNFDIFFNISTFENHFFYSFKTFSNSPKYQNAQQLNTFLNSFNPPNHKINKQPETTSNSPNHRTANTSTVLEETIFEQDVSQIKFISVQCNFSKQIHNISKIKLTAYLIYSQEMEFNLYFHMYFSLFILVIISIKTFKMHKANKIKLDQFIPVIYLSFCFVSTIPIFIFSSGEFHIFQKTATAILEALFYEISFSFIYFTFYSLPINIIESFFDFFLSILNLVYCFLFQILKMTAKNTNPAIMLILLGIIYVVRFIQKAYFWRLVPTKEPVKNRSLVYAVLNNVTVAALIGCNFRITDDDNLFLMTKFVVLVSYGMAMTVYNSF